MSDKLFNKEEMTTALELVFRHSGLTLNEREGVINEVENDILGHRNVKEFDNARSEESKALFECLDEIRALWRGGL